MRGRRVNPYGWHFKEARKVALERDKVCRVCFHDGSVYRLEAHHANVEAYRRECRPEDLTMLCYECHRKVTNRNREDRNSKLETKTPIMPEKGNRFEKTQRQGTRYRPTHPPLGETE